MTTSFKRGSWALCLAMLAIPAAASGEPARVIVTGDASPRVVVPQLASASSTRMRIGLTLVAAEPADTPLPDPASLGYPASPNAVLCRSDDQGYRGYRVCRTPFQGRVTLSREVGATHCIEHRNWGWHDGAVWVDQGCGAVFVSTSAK